jgi:hypothetical protein
MNTDQYQQQRKKAGTDARFDGRRSNREKGKKNQLSSKQVKETRDSKKWRQAEIEVMQK